MMGWVGRAGVSLVLIVMTTPLMVSAYRDGPPPGNMGGFGESSCHECHFDQPLNDPQGSLTIDGFPEFYRANSSYRVRILLERPGLIQGGFQLSTRFADGPRKGRQAGSLQPVDRDVRVVEGDAKIQYAHQFEHDDDSFSGDLMTWTLLWMAPQSSGAPVALHVAANAGNDDESSLGDFIYLKEVISKAGSQEFDNAEILAGGLSQW